MHQVTLRLSEGLVRQLKLAAERSGTSLNAWAGRVLQAAVDPDLATDEAERVRDRLRRAGLLVEDPTRVREPDRARAEAARRRAGQGRSLADIVSEDRR